MMLSNKLKCVISRPLYTSRASTRLFAIEKGARQTTDTPPKEPLAEEDASGDMAKIKEEYEEILASKSGTAEDVSIKDEQQSTLGKMAAEPGKIEGKYRERASQMAEQNIDRSIDNPKVVEAVFNDDKDTKETMSDTITGAEETKPRVG